MDERTTTYKKTYTTKDGEQKEYVYEKNYCVPLLCECGRFVDRTNIVRHRRTRIHLKYLALKENNNEQ